jgi:hypothetical protein
MLSSRVFGYPVKTKTTLTNNRRSVECFYKGGIPVLPQNSPAFNLISLPGSVGGAFTDKQGVVYTLL